MNLQELGWDTSRNSSYIDVLKPKIAFNKILRELPKEHYTKGELRKVVQGKDLMKVIAEAIPLSDFGRKVLGHLTSICAETNHKLTIWRELDYVGNELEAGVITIMRAPGKRHTAGEYLGYKMKGGLIRVNGKARSIGPTLGGIIWANEVDKMLYPNKAEIYLGNQAQLQSFYYQEKYGRGEILDELLQKMDNYDWSLVKDIPADEIKKEGKLKYFKDVIEHSGMKLDGSILEFDAGPVSIGHLYKDLIAIDSDPRNVKNLRQEGIRAIIGSIDKTPIEDKSFDYVVAFNPLIARPEKGWRWVNKTLGQFDIISSDYKEKIVKRAIGIAREKILMASIDIALNPPCKDKVEKKVLDPYYYVVYDVKAG